MNRFALAALLLFPFAATASAAPLNPALVPEDAQWVIHVDFEALAESSFGQKLRNDRPQLVQNIRRFLQERYGIDPQQDLQGVTLFSDTYAAHTGAIVLQADFDREKVTAQITQEPNVKKTTFAGHTLYTWPLERHKSGAGEEVNSITVALLDGKRAVFASSEERAESVVKLLEGDAPSLEDQKSKLIADVPPGAFFYGAAIDLQRIARRDRLFPILQQHERIVWSFGEHDGAAFENVTLVAESHQVASHMKETLEGLAAFMAVWAADDKNLKRLALDVEVSQEAYTVKADWQADADTVIAALEELKDRIGSWKQARSD